MSDELSATYAPASQRWGLLLDDYPDATRMFEMADDAPIPPEFTDGARFVKATVDRCDGRPPVHGYRAIPATVERWVGTRGARAKQRFPFEMTAENWEWLCDKALDRALTAAGYPDDTRDIKAVLLWRQRRTEMEAVRDGIKIRIGELLSDAEPFDSTGHHPADEKAGDPRRADDHAVIDAADVDITTVEWHPDVLEAVTGLPEDQQREVYLLAVARSITVADPGDKMPALVAIIEGKTT